MPKKPIKKGDFNNEEVTARFKALLRKHGTTRYEAVKIAKLGQTSVGDCVNGKANWTYNIINKLAQVFGIPTDELAYGTAKPSNVIDMPDKKPEIKPTEIKVYSKVAAGREIERWEADAKLRMIEIFMPELSRIRGQKLGFEIDGDSMLDRFRKGDTVICTEYPENKYPEDYDIVVMFYDTGLDTVSGNCKLFFWADKKREDFILQPINSFYPSTRGYWDKVTKVFKVHMAISPIDYSAKHKK